MRAAFLMTKARVHMQYKNGCAGAPEALGIHAFGLALLFDEARVNVMICW
jgi:hypothetical protein